MYLNKVSDTIYLNFFFFFEYWHCYWFIWTLFNWNQYILFFQFKQKKKFITQHSQANQQTKAFLPSITVSWIFAALCFFKYCKKISRLFFFTTKDLLPWASADSFISHLSHVAVNEETLKKNKIKRLCSYIPFVRKFSCFFLCLLILFLRLGLWFSSCFPVLLLCDQFPLLSWYSIKLFCSISNLGNRNYKDL